jgi:hypothetical protein
MAEVVEAPPRSVYAKAGGVGGMVERASLDIALRKRRAFRVENTQSPPALRAGGRRRSRSSAVSCGVSGICPGSPAPPAAPVSRCGSATAAPAYGYGLGRDRRHPRSARAAPTAASRCTAPSRPGFGRRAGSWRAAGRSPRVRAPAADGAQGAVFVSLELLDRALSDPVLAHGETHHVVQRPQRPCHRFLGAPPCTESIEQFRDVNHRDLADEAPPHQGQHVPLQVVGVDLKRSQPCVRRLRLGARNAQATCGTAVRAQGRDLLCGVRGTPARWGRSSPARTATECRTRPLQACREAPSGPRALGRCRHRATTARCLG